MLKPFTDCNADGISRKNVQKIEQIYNKVKFNDSKELV